MDDERFLAVLAEIESKKSRTARLAELAAIGAGPPAGEEAILAELDDLLLEGVLVEVEP
jgi:hypothetical protein